MKKLFKNTSSKLCTLFLIVFSQLSFANGTRGLVTDVQGNVFVIRGEKTFSLKVGTQLKDFDEIMTETNGLISFADYYGHHYFLSGSGHMKIYNRMIELKSGYVWLKSEKGNFDYSAQTANSILSYDKGEGILSFDPYAGKTQFLNVKGDFDFGNILQKEIKTPVREGRFTYIDNKLGSGVPRRPTPIGYDSFKKIVSLFNGLNPAEAKESKAMARQLRRMQPRKKSVVPQKRSIASVPQSNVKKGTIKLIQSNVVGKEEQKKSVANYLSKHMKKMVKKVDNRPWRPAYGKKSNVKVQVFGRRNRRKVKKSAPRVQKASSHTSRVRTAVPQKREYRKVSSSRAPASVNKTGFSGKSEKSDPFEKSLMNNYKKQMRHSKEVNSLIQDLKNYRQDYQISY